MDYTDNVGSVDGLVDSADTIVENIMVKLRTGRIDTIEVDTESGEVSLVEKKIEFGKETPNNETMTPQIGSLSSQFVGAGSTTHQGDYSMDKVVGVELIVEAIVREVLDQIVKNGEVAMKTRMDKLEEDFNTLLASLVTSFIPAVGVTPPGAVTIAEYNLMITAVQASLAAVGGAARQGVTEGLIADNEMVVPSTGGIPVEVQIK